MTMFSHYVDAVTTVQLEGGGWGRALTTTGEVYVIPAAWKGKAVLFTAQGGDMCIAANSDSTFAASTPSTVSTLTGDVLGSAAVLGDYIPSNTSRILAFDDRSTHFRVVSTAATGFWKAKIAVRHGEF